MIQSETFEKQYLQGQSKEEVTDVIRDLEYVLAGLKGALEYVCEEEDLGEWYAAPEAAQLQQFDQTEFCEAMVHEEFRAMLADFADRADVHRRITEVRICLAMGYCELDRLAPGAYLSKREHADRALSARLQHLRSIRFRRGGFRTKGFESVIKLQGDAITYFWGMMQYGMLSDEEEPDSGDLSMSREELMGRLAAFHLGEWNGDYVDEYAAEGEQWTLILYFEGSPDPWEVKGVELFPWNFDEVAEFMNAVQ